MLLKALLHCLEFSCAEVGVVLSLIMAPSHWLTSEVGEHVPVLLTRPQRAESGVDNVEIRNEELTMQFAQNREE